MFHILDYIPFVIVRYCIATSKLPKYSWLECC